jgi:hypothetical protein
VGIALEIINAFATNPGAGPGLVATTLFGGDTAAVRNFNSPSRAFLEQIWATEATAGVVRIRSPRLHDNVQNLRYRTIAAQNRELLPEQAEQLLYAQDLLIAELFGGAAESDGMAWMNYYEDLPGTSARLSTWSAIQPRIVNLVTVEVAIGGGAAIGTYATSVALNATFDLLQANTDYALLGYMCDAAGLSIGIRGPDTGNLRVGGPMTTERLVTWDWFLRQDRLDPNKGWIPIINSANKGATLLDNAQVVAGVATNVTLNLAQLHP